MGLNHSHWPHGAPQGDQSPGDRVEGRGEPGEEGGRRDRKKPGAKEEGEERSQQGGMRRLFTIPALGFLI